MQSEKVRLNCCLSFNLAHYKAYCEPKIKGNYGQIGTILLVTIDAIGIDCLKFLSQLFENPCSVDCLHDKSVLSVLFRFTGFEHRRF